MNIFKQGLISTHHENVNCQLILEKDVAESAVFMERFIDWTDGMTIEVRETKNIAIKDKTRHAFDRGGCKFILFFV